MAVDRGKGWFVVSSWWLLWMGFVFACLLSPVGYGWVYRGWGPPYPRYVQLRRALRVATRAPTGFDHHAWSWRGDLVWVAMLVGAGWLLALVLWSTRSP